METIYLGLAGRHGPRPQLSCYRVAGCGLAVDQPIAQLDPFRVASSSVAGVSPVYEPGGAVDRGELIHDGTGWVGNATRRIRSWFDGSTHVIWIEGIGDFSVSGDGSEIVLLDKAESADDAVVVEAVLGPALILALAIRGVFCLHASAVTLGGGVVLFLGESGDGKSTMAEMLQEADSGIKRLTDDISPIRHDAESAEILPDFPQLKLAAKDQFASQNQHAQLKLRTIYRLGRTLPGDADPHRVSRQRLGPVESFSRLAGQGVASRLFTEDLLRAHARQTAKLADLVPVYELTYPSGAEHFESTRDFLLGAHR